MIKELGKYLVIDKLEVGPVQIEKRKLTAPYTVHKGKSKESVDFIYSFEEDVFDPSDDSYLNLASVMAAQIALNYGLFCKKIVFNGLYDNSDKRALHDWAENTSREIYVKKLLEENPFLTEKPEGIVKSKSYLQAELLFNDINQDAVSTTWEFWQNNKNKHCILSSGGKDSLLSYGLLNEMGYETHPIFVNESGRHWFTALNAYKHFKENIKNTGRVWVNSDRVFSFMLRQLPFIRKDFTNIRSDEYPIRLWTVAIFLFGVIPLLRKKGVGRLVIGDEYDTTVRSAFRGITHYNGLYDQSRYFDESLTRYFFSKGWGISQFSILRPLSELLIETILAKRYPELLKHQMSCHATHIENERVKPCGNCEKCRRIVGMLTAVDIDPQNCGYTPEQIQKCLSALSQKSIHQERSGSDHLLLLLHNKGSLTLSQPKASKLREHPEILKCRFDHERSPMVAIPTDLRKPLYEIYLQYTAGAVRMISRKWTEINPFKDPAFAKPYPFELSSVSTKNHMKSKAKLSTKYLWGELTWPEADERLKATDTALLPVGAIEQHGPHLPLDVDAFDADYLAKKVAEACSEPRPLVLPVIHYGVSYHHEDFPGTISVTNETLGKFVYEVGMSVARSGIKKLIIINGHGDNSPTMNYAAQMINRDAKIFVAVDTGETSDVDLDDLVETQNDVHAGEIETSTTLAIRPDLVQMEKAKKGVLKFRSRYLNFSSLRGVPWYSRTKKISESGIMGDPTKADAEKGKKMWEIMIAHLVAFVEDLKNLSLDEIHQKKY